MWVCSHSTAFLALGWSLKHLRSVSSCLSILPTDGRVGGSHFTLLPTYGDRGARLTNGFIERCRSLEPNWGKCSSNEQWDGKNTFFFFFYQNQNEISWKKHFILKAPFVKFERIFLTKRKNVTPLHSSCNFLGTIDGTESSYLPYTP